MHENIYTEEEQYWCQGGNTGLLPTNITPSQVNVLADGEIFVFGSNFQGAHMGGAARVAKEKFGAVWGIGEGLQGKSYAIPTMEGLDILAPAVQRFTSFAQQHKELGGTLVFRSGKFGEIFGCSNYPKCKYTHPA